MAVEPRRPKGPHLNALRAFEAAARLNSFVAAAEELGVTAGAVSQHVKAVEAWAGTPLFERNARGVALLPPGRNLLCGFTQAFDQLAAATQSLRNLAPNPDLHIAALPSIAQLWLPARLGRLRAVRPELNISVTALETEPDLSRALFDLSVFYAVPDNSPDQIVIATDRIYPVCAPGLANRHNLEQATLLHDQTWQDDWAIWSAQTGIGVGDTSGGPRYSLYALAVEEAKSGAGVLMGHEALILPALEEGSLVRAATKEGQTDRALILRLPHQARRHPDTEPVVGILQDAMP